VSWTPERWARIESVFLDAAERDAAARASYLDEACGGDHELRRAVERLLAVDTAPPDLLDRGAVDAVRACDPLLGRRLGPFRVTEKIADGGMGSVYRAERVEGGFEQVVAIKVLRFGPASAALHARFLRERQTLARLSHPHIARLLDGGETADGRHYFAMELVDGEPLDRYCDGRGLDLRARLGLFAIACRAVHFAHQNLVVHLDLKPSNVLVDAAGQPKLLDFGVAGLLDGEPIHAELDAHQRPLTPRYASPEQLAGQPTNIAADVYALGVVLAELTGIGAGDARLPGTGSRGGDRGRRPRRSERVVVADVAHIVRRARQSVPIQRYASCQEFADDVERSLRGFPLRARAGERAYRLRCFVRRNRVAVGALLALLVALIGGLVATSRAASIARAEMEHARIEATSSTALASFLGDTFLSTDLVARDARHADLRATIMRRAERVRRQYPSSPHLRANLLDALGRIATELALYDDAEVLLSEARDDRVATFGKQSLEHALSLTSLGRLHYAQGCYADAAAAFAESYQLALACPHGVHTDVAAAANDLAAAERALGRLDRALALHREALALRRADGDAVLVAESLNNVASVEPDRACAEQDMREALALREQLLGADDPLTIQSRINLARILLARGEPAPAAPLLGAAAASARRLGALGAEALGQSCVTLAFVELQLGRLDAAARAADEALAVTSARFGAGHPSVAACLEARAKVLEQRGEFAAAVEVWREVLQLRERLLPADHRDVVNSACSLGAALARSGATEEAVAVLRDVVARHAAAAPPRPRDLLDARINLADALTRAGVHAEAEAAWLQVWADCGGGLVPPSRRAWVKERIAAFYRACGRPDQALRFERESEPRD